MKKKAFTLTELLVVVVIIGTLAAVVLPKFTKVLETRKTTEAENIMQAVRTEQEARCTLDKKYATTFDELAAGPTSTSSNYTYGIEGAGVSAASKSKGYTLRIRSYANGGICCDGDYCSKLNKSYPKCSETSIPAADSTADNACLPEGVEPEPEPEPEPCTLTPKTKTLTCQEAGHPAGYTGSVTQTVDEETCQYVTTSDTCVKIVCAEGADEKVGFKNCDQETWHRCEGNTWVEYTKDVTSTDCRQGCGKPDDQTKMCPDGKTQQTATYTCNNSNGQWILGAYTPECPNTCPVSWAAQSCEEPQGSDTPGTWVGYPDCRCDCPTGYKVVDYECVKADEENQGGQDCAWVQKTVSVTVEECLALMYSAVKGEEYSIGHECTAGSDPVLKDVWCAEGSQNVTNAVAHYLHCICH